MVKKIPIELLECKAFNHAWEPAALHPDLNTSLIDALLLVCTRCASAKVQGIGKGGYLNSTTYHWSAHYESLKLDYPDLDKQAARMEILALQNKAKRKLKAV